MCHSLLSRGFVSFSGIFAVIFFILKIAASFSFCSFIYYTVKFDCMYVCMWHVSVLREFWSFSRIFSQKAKTAQRKQRGGSKQNIFGIWNAGFQIFDEFLKISHFSASFTTFVINSSNILVSVE